jgi:hypothetical protein
VAKHAAGGQFGEFDCGQNFGFEPDVIFHVLGGYAFAPMTTWRSATTGGRKVGEGAARGGQGFEQCSCGRVGRSASHARGQAVHDVLAAGVGSFNFGVGSVCRNVALTRAASSTGRRAKSDFLSI